jgi:hypothetical protein
MIQDSRNPGDCNDNVFVGCASPDAAAADAVVEKFGSHCIKCWVAPRVVPPAGEHR